MLILGILGSASKNSGARAGLEGVAERVRAAGAQFRLIDLATEFREPHDLADYDDPDPGGQTAAVRERVAEADGIVLATPVYHGSYSGLLKNFLDQLLGTAFAGKPVGILANGGGPRSAGTACDQMRTVVRAISGWATPSHIATTGSDYTDGRPSEFIGSRMDALVADLLSFANARQAAARPGKE
ncbi:NADPH-dependent FMN reductase [Streptomyces sp. TS71-3]|uniref:NADPH-dependent FMN reductase n=1 Tax=Streptomyces sp. TS71-3 TaxID=2733862 RepID=UPI001B020F88|nr:NAD(P)H-dependent oxidoreductase [Streptomyces sp. TS71-3]GHJ36890.1 FMN-dependent NADPH-azoreductase [Streptomyces sp. TS71-3]